MDSKDMEDMIRKMLEKPSSNLNNASHSSYGNGSVDLNNESLIKEKLSSFFLQQMLEKQQQQQQQTASKSPAPSTSQTSPQKDNKDVKVDLTLPDVENLVKLLLQNVNVTNQDKSALEEEKAKRRALEMEAEEMRLKIKAFEKMHQPTEAAEVQKKLDAFETMNFFQSGKGGESLNSTMAKYLEDLMLKDKLAKKKLFNDPKWFPGSSEDAASSNTNSSKDKDLFKEMLGTPFKPGMQNFMQPGTSGHPGPFHGPHGGPQPPPFHGNVPPYQQNGYPMGHAPYPWPGHGPAPGIFPQQPPHMMGYGAPGSMPWQGAPHGFPGPYGPNQQGMPPQQKKQKQPQPQNPPKQKQQQQQNQQPKQQQQNQQSKQKQPQPQQQNPPKQKQQQQQNQPKQKQAQNNVPPNQEGGKKKKNTQNQEQNGAQPKIAVPVGSCVTLSPNSNSPATAAQNGNVDKSTGGINLTQEEINQLKQSIQLMNSQASTTGKKKKNKKKKNVLEGGNNVEGEDSGSGEEGEKGKEMVVKNNLGGEGAKKKENVEQKKKEGGESQQVVVAPGEGKKKKKKKAGGEGNSDFSLYVGDRWPTLDDINAGRLKLDQPVKNILMVAKTAKGDIISTPKIIQDMLVFNKLHPTAVLVFSSD